MTTRPGHLDPAQGLDLYLLADPTQHPRHDDREVAP